jgi:hypothetical protein
LTCNGRPSGGDPAPSYVNTSLRMIFVTAVLQRRWRDGSSL